MENDLATEHSVYQGKVIWKNKKFLQQVHEMNTHVEQRPGRPRLGVAVFMGAAAASLTLPASILPQRQPPRADPLPGTFPRPRLHPPHPPPALKDSGITDNAVYLL